MSIDRKNDKKYVLCSISLISASCSFLCKLHLLWFDHINPPPLCAATVVLFCMAALIFPMGFYIKEVGGQPYKLPNNTVVGSSYVLFVLSIFFTIVGLLFAGKVCLPGWPGWGAGGHFWRNCSTWLMRGRVPLPAELNKTEERIFLLVCPEREKSQEAPPQSLRFVQRWRGLNWPLCVIRSEQWDWQAAAHNGEWIKISRVGRRLRCTFHSCWNSAWRVVERSWKWDLFHGASVRRRTLLHCIYYWFMFSLLLSDFVWKWSNSSQIRRCNQFSASLCLNELLNLKCALFSLSPQCMYEIGHARPSPLIVNSPGHLTHFLLCSTLGLWQVSDLDMHQPPDWTAVRQHWSHGLILLMKV